MIISPCCKRQIGNLVYTQREITKEYFTIGEHSEQAQYSDLVREKWGDEWECPRCGQVLARTEKDAVSILKEKEVKIRIKDLKETKKEEILEKHKDKNITEETIVCIIRKDTQDKEPQSLNISNKMVKQNEF